MAAPAQPTPPAGPPALSPVQQKGVKFGEQPTPAQIGAEVDALTVDPSLPPPGLARFAEVRRRFLTQKLPLKPIPGTPMDAEAIMDAVECCPGDRLDPPVALPFMCEVLVELWEDEGLYS